MSQGSLSSRSKLQKCHSRLLFEKTTKITTKMQANAARASRAEQSRAECIGCDSTTAFELARDLKAPSRPLHVPGK